MRDASPADVSCTVTDHRVCGPGLKLLRLMPEAGSMPCQPGQFVMIDLMGEAFAFRRPFSVMRVQADGSFDIFYRIVGRGTRRMADWQPGQTVRALGPLGKPFTPPTQPETALMIGGGIGIAPMALFAESLRKANQPVGHCVYGARSLADLGVISELEALFGAAHCHFATDDGSHGTPGNVCDALRAMPERVAAAKEAYICGPTRMMAAATALLRELNPALRIEVSLEEHMPCGTGACSGCVVPRVGNRLPAKVCVEGPVFDATEILWDPEAPWPSAESCAVAGRASAQAGEAVACPPR